MKKLFVWLLIVICACVGAASAASGESAQAECQHENIVYGPAEKKAFLGDQEYHRWEYFRPAYCAACGEYIDYLSDFEWIEDEEHQFNDAGYCVVCGCVRNCRHPNAERDYSLTRWPSNVTNPNYHALETHIRYYCPDCGELYWDIEPGSAVYEPHEFNEEGDCVICWYNRNSGRFSSSHPLPDSVPAKGTVTVGDTLITPIRLDIRLLGNADSRHLSCSGPGKEYESTGGFMPMKIRSTYAWFIEGDYVLTDVSYQTVKRCTVYLKKSAFNSLDGVPEIDLSQLAQPAAVTGDTVPSMFPRANRRMFDKKTVMLSAGTPVTVFFEKDGWYYCEFTSKNKKPARGWIQKESVTMTNGQ